MKVLQRTGSVPGIVFATIEHGNTTSTLSIDVRVAQSGHYVSRLSNGRWSTACLTVDSAILMHAAPLFPDAADTPPWLANPQISPYRTPAHRQAALIMDAQKNAAMIDAP